MEMLLCATEPDFMRCVVLADYPGATEVEDRTLYRVKKRRQRRKKHKTVSWKSDHHKHRTYEYGFCEMLRRTLTQSYVKRCVTGDAPDTDQLLSAPPADIQAKIVAWEGTGCLNHSFERGYGRVIAWLEAECGMSKAGAATALGLVSLMHERKSKGRLVGLMSELSTRDFVLLKFYMQCDQNQNHILRRPLGIATNFRTAVALQRKKHCYTNVCCTPEDLYNVCVPKTLYLTGYAPCCGRIAALSHTPGHGLEATTNSTPIEYLVGHAMTHTVPHRILCCAHSIQEEQKMIQKYIANEERDDTGMEDEECEDEADNDIPSELEPEEASVPESKLDGTALIKFDFSSGALDRPLVVCSSGVSELSKSKRKELTNRAMNNYRDSQRSPCNTEPYNVIVPFRAFGHLVLDMLKTGETVMYMHCSRCANFCVYRPLLVRDGHFVCQRCSVRDPVLCVSVTTNTPHTDVLPVTPESTVCIHEDGVLLTEKPTSIYPNRHYTVVNQANDPDVYLHVEKGRKPPGTVNNEPLAKRPGTRTKTTSEKPPAATPRNSAREIEYEALRQSARNPGKLRAYLGTSFYTTDTSGRLRSCVMSNLAAASNDYLANPQDHTACRFRNSVDLKMEELVFQAPPEQRAGQQ
jgi:hypothetical protein